MIQLFLKYLIYLVWAAIWPIPLPALLPFLIIFSYFQLHLHILNYVFSLESIENVHAGTKREKKN